MVASQALCKENKFEVPNLPSQEDNIDLKLPAPIFRHPAYSIQTEGNSTEDGGGKETINCPEKREDDPSGFPTSPQKPSVSARTRLAKGGGKADTAC